MSGIPATYAKGQALGGRGCFCLPRVGKIIEAKKGAPIMAAVVRPGEIKTTKAVIRS